MRADHRLAGALSRHWSLAWPLILANCAIPLLGLADAAIAGHLDQAYYLAAVTVGAELFAVFFGSFSFLRMGTTGLVAQSVGPTAETQSLKILSNALILGACIGLVIAGMGALAIVPIIQAIQPAAELTTPLSAYIEIRLLSAPASLMSFAISGWFIGRGHTRIALYLALGVNALNILLNYILAIGLEMNSNGIALGTVIAEYLGLGYAAFWLSRVSDMSAFLRTIGLERHVLGRLVRVNGPLFIRTLALQVVFVGLSVQAARIGVTEAAAVGLFLVLLATAAYALDGFAFASEIEAGQAFGAGERQRFTESLWAGASLTLFTTVLIVIAVANAGPLIINLLTTHAPVQTAAIGLLPWFHLILLVLCLSYWLDGVFIGLTRSLEMCITMCLATAMGWFGALWWTGGQTVEDVFIAFFCFGLLRTVLLASRLPSAWRSVKSSGTDHPTQSEPV